MEKIKVTNFTLSYDGMYKISWKDYSVRVFLELNDILKMLEIERCDLHFIDEKIKAWEPIPFSKVALFFFGEQKDGIITSFRTSDGSEDYMEYGIYLIELEIDSVSSFIY